MEPSFQVTSTVSSVIPGNGTWKTVDVTWNDGGDSRQEAIETRYLMIDNNSPLLTKQRTWKDPAIKKIL